MPSDQTAVIASVSVKVLLCPVVKALLSWEIRNSNSAETEVVGMGKRYFQVVLCN